MINDIDSILGDRFNTDQLIELLSELESEKSDLILEIEDVEGQISTHETTIDEETNDEGGLSGTGVVATNELSSAHINHERLKRELEEKQEEIDRIDKIKERFSEGEIPEDLDLISESDFQNYAEEYATETGSMNGQAQWPFTHIDWAAAADELKMDYTTVEIESTTYYYKE